MSQTYPVELTAPDIEPYRAGNTGVEYVTSFDSGVAGPHVMINAVTHGNEICGAITLDYLLRNDLRPDRGKLTLGFINHAAYARFDPTRPTESRFVDEDFNRVWVEARLDGEEDTSELRRARELRPVFDDVDYLLDIHSMGTYSPALMICNGLAKEVSLTARVGYPGYIMCGSGHVVGKRLIEYTPFNDTRNGKVAMLVECGQHWAASTGPTALNTALHFLRATETVGEDFLDAHCTSPAERHPPAAAMYQVTDGVTAQSDDFRFVENFVGMEIIPKAGTVIAHDGDREVTTPYDDCLLMMPNHVGARGARRLRLCRRM